MNLSIMNQNDSVVYPFCDDDVTSNYLMEIVYTHIYCTNELPEMNFRDNH